MVVGVAGHPVLSQSAIVAVGRRLAEAHGVDAVSMRRVASELGCSPMALYRHVSDKRELLVLVLDDVAAGMPLTVPVGPPAAQLVGLFEACHGYLSGFPWVVDVLREGELYAPRALRFVEAALAALAAAGIEGRTAVQIYTALWHYTLGHLASAHPKDPAVRAIRESIARRAPLADLPRVRSVMPLFADFDYEATFSAGLTALVRGALMEPQPGD